MTEGAGGQAHGVARADQASVLGRALLLLGLVLVAEVVGGLVTGSLALLSDAGHVLTDLVGVSSALLAVRAAQRVDTTSRRSFGLHRLEVLSALGNALLLGVVAIWIVVEAIGRIADPPPVDTGPLLVVAALGLVANLVVLRWFGALEGDAMHVVGARLEVLADTLGSVAVLVGGVVVAVTGWRVVDPLLALAIGAFVLPRVLHLARRAVRVLLPTAPDDVDLAAVEAGLIAIGGVAGAHDFHAWTLTSGIDVATVHLVLSPDVGPDDHHRVLDEAHAVLRAHRLEHATVQLEPADHRDCDPHAHWQRRSGHGH